MATNIRNPYIYLRALREVDHTVFCVADGQKTYYDPVFNRRVAYSSGQQVKRSILDSLVAYLGERRAPVTFNYSISKDDKLEQKEPWSSCDPSYVDQLLGGWMHAQTDALIIKRRSPLSVSALRPLHPLLASHDDENLTFDRSDEPDRHPVRVVNAQGEELSESDILEYLQSKGRSLTRRHWIPNAVRTTTGLFISDVAVDLRRLFRVSLNQHEPELTPETIETLIGSGWKKSKDEIDLVCPEEKRDSIVPALAHGLINWRVTSNQSRTFSPQNTLALVVSENANEIGNSIRADLDEEGKAMPIVDQIGSTRAFVALACQGYVSGVTGSSDALEEAEKYLIDKMKSFNPEF